jgi:hypothetical protein
MYRKKKPRRQPGREIKSVERRTQSIERSASPQEFHSVHSSNPPILSSPSPETDKNVSIQNLTSRPSGPVWKWPPHVPPKLSPKAIQRINWVIGEAEQHFKERLAGLPESDPIGHDRQLEYLLLDWASKIYCDFLEEANEALRQGNWTRDDFGTHAGLFITDVGEGAFLKFQNLAVLAENRVEWKAYVFAHSELVYAVLNSVRNSQKGIELTQSARAHLFERSPDSENALREIAAILKSEVAHGAKAMNSTPEEPPGTPAESVLPRMAVANDQGDDALQDALKKGGRPRFDAERARARELRAEGKTWPQIANIANREFQSSRTADAWRKFAESHPSRASEKAPLNPEKTPEETSFFPE